MRAARPSRLSHDRRRPSLLTEPGGANRHDVGHAGTAPFAYRFGRIFLDGSYPTAVIGRLAEPFLRVDPAEAQGQVGNVVFAEGVVRFGGRRLLYSELADPRTGVSFAG